MFPNVGVSLIQQQWKLMSRSHTPCVTPCQEARNLEIQEFCSFALKKETAFVNQRDIYTLAAH